MIRNEIFRVLQSVGDIPDSEIQRLIDLGKTKPIASGDYFIREGHKTYKLGFVEKGLFRNMYLTEKGEESTFAFAAENDFVYECKAIRTFEPAEYSIQAIENSVLLEVDYKTWVEPFKESVWWNKILLDLTALESSLKSNRERELVNFSGKERYACFLEKYSSIEHRIKQHVIASYLGITSVSLSRIRREMGLIA